MPYRTNLHTASGATLPPMESTPIDDYLLVPRSTIAQIHAHIAAEHERFPARRLSQTLRILRHLLGDRGRKIV
jgi:hypothetical protein